MLLENLLPNLTTDINSIIIYVIAGLGIILLVYAIFLETEKRQDIIFIISAFVFLFMHSL